VSGDRAVGEEEEWFVGVGVCVGGAVGGEVGLVLVVEVFVVLGGGGGVEGVEWSTSSQLASSIPRNPRNWMGSVRLPLVLLSKSLF
jgi:hypothetical protein